MSKTKTMSWANEGRLAITVHTAHPPHDDEWSAYVDSIRPLGDLSRLRVLVVSHGGGPNGRQRHLLVETFRGQAAPTALLTSNSLMRGIGTAISWFNRDLRLFPLENLDAAFEYLELDDQERETACEIVANLEDELGIIDRVSDRRDAGSIGAK